MLQNLRINNVTSKTSKNAPRIFVAGIGGAGGNATDNMIATNMSGVDFLVCNTDDQALQRSLAENRIQLGSGLTEGLGAGAKPEVGRAAAEETLDEVMQYLDQANMVFITAGMGGGTGTGAAPVIARACREKGILTVGVVTKPFHFEGSLRMKMAEEGIAEMQHYVDTLIVIPNQNLFRVVNEKTTFADAFKLADGVLQSAVRGVTDLIVIPGLINLDFADIRSVMQEMGKAVMGVGEATGERRATEAAEKAISNPLLDDISMKGARGVIVNVTGGYDMTLFEVDEACNRIRDEVDPNANIIFGSSFDENMDGTMRVSVIATGIDAAVAEKKSRPSTGSFMPVDGKSTVDAARLKSSQPPTRLPGFAAAAAAAPRAEAPVPMPAAPAMPMTESAVYPSAAESQAIPQVQPQAYAQMQSQPVQPPVFTAPAYAAQVQPDVVPASYPPPVDVSPDTAIRGQRYQGAFIPPQPVDSGRNRNETWSAPTPTAYAAQAEVKAAPITAELPERRKPTSLFERITSGIRREIAAVRDGDDADETRSQPQTTKPAVKAEAQRRRSPEMPAQGRLNIDAPSAASPGDPELEIPAFLRRQAN
jgi:cell division protein FtsZ